MCGRYSQAESTAKLRERFGFPNDVELTPRYNIAPGQLAPLIVGKKRLALLRWGLTPKWADPKTGYRMINARAETLSEKRAYRRPFLESRCLVLADGFYEWKKLGAKAKAPIRFARRDRAPFAFAGLCDNGTFTIVTAAANAAVKPVHDRMPVILTPEAEGAWLDPKTGLEELNRLLVPLEAALLEAHPVSMHVNSTKNDDPRCIEAAAPPVSEDPQLDLL